MRPCSAATPSAQGSSPADEQAWSGTPVPHVSQGSTGSPGLTGRVPAPATGAKRGTASLLPTQRLISPGCISANVPGLPASPAFPPVLLRAPGHRALRHYRAPRGRAASPRSPRAGREGRWAGQRRRIRRGRGVATSFHHWCCLSKSGWDCAAAAPVYRTGSRSGRQEPP